MPPTIDEKFSYIDAFLQGFRYHESLASSLNCSQNLHRAIKTLEATKETWTGYGTGDWPLFLFDTTKWISYTLAPSSRYCYVTVLEGWEYYDEKKEQFPRGFDDWFPAWLQSVLGDVVTVNSIRNKLSEATSLEDRVA